MKRRSGACASCAGCACPIVGRGCGCGCGNPDPFSADLCCAIVVEPLSHLPFSRFLLHSRRPPRAPPPPHRLSSFHRPRPSPRLAWSPPPPPLPPPPSSSAPPRPSPRRVRRRTPERPGFVVSTPLRLGNDCRCVDDRGAPASSDPGSGSGSGSGSDPGPVRSACHGRLCRAPCRRSLKRPDRGRPCHAYDPASHPHSHPRRLRRLAGWVGGSTPSSE